MIPIDRLKNITHLITHAGCPDGQASAHIVKDALPDVKVSFMAYGSKEHRELEPAPGMIFCDFTPYVGDTSKYPLNREEGSVLDCWVKAGAIVLDHHPTARDLVDHFSFKSLGFFGENEKNECGAWLAFQHVWLPLEKAKPVEQTKWSRIAVEDFAKLAAIRDTWKKDSPDWQRACAQAAELMFWGERTSLGDMLRAQIGTLGQHLLDKQLSAAQRSLEESHLIITGKGTEVWMFQGVSTTSDAAELAEKSVEKTLHEQVGPSQPDLVVGFHYKVDGGKLKLQFSTRSHTGFDCAAFAKSHPGGGGHKAAAGFTVEVSPELSANPYQVFRILLEEFEGG